MQKNTKLKGYEITKDELKSIIGTGYGSFYEKHIDHCYKELDNSVPVHEDLIRISCDCCLPEMFYNFRFRTSNQLAYFYLCTALGDINDVWKFLETICNGEKFCFYMSEQEGPFALLIAKCIDDENIRLTLLNYDWYETEYNHEKRTPEFYRKRHKDKRQHVNFDAILNKKNFVYTFYICLQTIFDKDDPCHGKNKILHSVTSEEEAQRDSETIKKYLGYVLAGKKDLKLYSLLKTFNLKEIEKVLKDGANPNALVHEIYSGYYPMLEAFFQNMACKYNVNRKVYAVTKLLVKYGAKTQSIYSAIWGNWNLLVIKYLIKHNCVFDDHSIGDVSTDAYYIDDPEAESSKWYQRLEAWYDKQLFDVSDSYIDNMEDKVFPKYGYFGED